jgi:hypothetical protein
MRFARSPRWVTSVEAVPPRPRSRDSRRQSLQAIRPPRLLFRRYGLDVRQRPRFVEQRFGRTVESEHQFEAAVRVGRDPVRFSGFRLPQWGQRRRQQGKTGGKTGNNSNVLAPMPALKPLIWSVSRAP